MGQIIGPYRSFGVTRMQLNIDVNLSWPHIDEVAVLPDTPGLTDLDVIDRHIHLVGIEGSYILGNTSDRREDATPVGVISCDSRCLLYTSDAADE